MEKSSKDLTITPLLLHAAPTCHRNNCENVSVAIDGGCWWIFLMTTHHSCHMIFWCMFFKSQNHITIARFSPTWTHCYEGCPTHIKSRERGNVATLQQCWAHTPLLLYSALSWVCIIAHDWHHSKAAAVPHIWDLVDIEQAQVGKTCFTGVSRVTE